MPSFTSERLAEDSVRVLRDAVHPSAEPQSIVHGGVVMADLPPFPIVVGVTGHRDIVTGAREAVRAAVHAVLQELKEEFGAALHVMTALADGADQLVGDVAEQLDLKIIAVSPMPLGTYRAAKVTNKDGLDHHWNGDHTVLQLELPELCAPGMLEYDELHYEQLGALLSRRCHLLLALWDGIATAPGRGGTADVVRIRQQGEHDADGFIKSPLFAGAGSRLDLSPGGPVLQVVTPCDKNGEAVEMPGQKEPKAGERYLLPDGADPNAKPIPVTASRVIVTLREQVGEDFDQISRLNRRIARFGEFDRPVFRNQLGYLRVTGVAEPGGVAGLHLDRLRRLQAAADTAAQTYQRRLLGQFVPAASFGAMFLNGWKVWCDTRRPPRLGVLFFFVALVPLAVLLFETYAHLGRSLLALGLYLALFAGSFAYYESRIRPREWQTRFQDYRALAEAMRVQLFWALAATPVAASDNYLRKQGGELGWIPFALRGPALWAAALALALDRPQREIVTRGWIEDQRNYFVGPDPKVTAGKARLHEQAAKRGQRWARRFLFAGLAAALLLAPIEALHLEKLWPGPPDPQDWLLVLAATALAMAAFFTVSGNLRAYEAQAHSYVLMGRIFERARREATTTRAATNDAEFQALARELGREALAENAEWLLDHRHRPIEHRV